MSDNQMTEPIIPIKITEKAAIEIKKIREAKNIDADYGLRVGMDGGGCGGMSFVLGFDQKKETDDEYTIKGLLVYIDKKHVMYLIGMAVDYISNDDKNGFSFMKESELATY